MSFAVKIKKHARRWGWKRTILASVVRIGSRYLGVHVYRVRSRDAETIVPSPCRLPGVEYRRISEDELVKAAKDPRLYLERDFVQEAIARGDVPFGAFKGSTLAGYLWRSFSVAPHKNSLWVRVNPPYCYAYKAFARHEYRGQHIVPGILLFSDEYLFAQGYTHRIGFVEISNFSSLAMNKHIDSHWIGIAGYLHWFGQCFQFRSRQVANTGFEFFEIEKD